jgi:hypothetical protein
MCVFCLVNGFLIEAEVHVQAFPTIRDEVL